LSDSEDELPSGDSNHRSQETYDEAAPSVSPVSVVLTLEAVNEMNAAELREQLGHRKQYKQGNKADLVERLIFFREVIQPANQEEDQSAAHNIPGFQRGCHWIPLF